MGKGRFVALDGMRGAAALAVVLYHLGYSLPDGRIMQHGFLAVSFFFILSGFVLAHAYEARFREGLSFAAFAKARLIRLYPLYLFGALLGLAFPLSLLARGLMEDPNDFLIVAGLNVLLIPTPNTSYGAGLIFPFNGPAWSLFWEVVINLVFAALALRLTTKALGIILALGVLLLVASPWVAWSLLGLEGDASRHFALGPGSVLFPFFAGVALYRVYAARERNPRDRAPVWLLAAVLLALLALPGSQEDTLALNVFATVVIMPAIVWIGAAHSRPRGLVERASKLLGDASFAIYAIHVPLIWLADLVSRRLFDAPLLALGLPAAIAFCAALLAVSVLVDRALDRPVRRWLTRAFAAKPQSPLPRGGDRQAQLGSNPATPPFD